MHQLLLNFQFWGLVNLTTSRLSGFTLFHAIAKQQPPGVDYTADDLVQQMGNMEIDKEELDFSDTAIDIPPLPDYYHVDGGDHSQSKVDVVVHDVVDDIDSNVDIVDQTNDDE
jgi:hypothetical protein